MGLVKKHIDDLTYAIMERCHLTDDDKGRNHDRVFQWLMSQDVKRPIEELTELYKRRISNE